MLFCRRFLFFILIFLYLSSLHGRVINIPDDFETIQAGINGADAGDTVLVVRGQYIEHLNVSEPIFLLSNYPFTNDLEDIEQTIIDGNFEEESAISVLNLNNLGADSVQINGFTIQNVRGRSAAIVLENSRAALKNLIVQNNIVQFNGGIRCEGGSRLALENSIIRDNTSNMRGGGMSIRSSARSTIRNSLIQNNTSPEGGGIYVSGSNVELDSVTFEGNQSGNHGGAIRLGASDALIKYSSFLTNIAQGAGGAIYIYTEDREHEMHLIGCRFLNNHTEVGGGAIISRGDDNPVNITMDHCLFVDNSSTGEGGVLHLRQGSLEVVNCTVYGNVAETCDGFYVRSQNFSFLNTIFENNGEQDLNINSEGIIDYCNFADGENRVIRINGDVELGQGIIWMDSRFVDADQGDFRLREGSPCIDGGDPEFPLDPDSSFIEIGAYFYPQYASLHGTVTAFGDQEPLVGSSIVVSDNYQTQSDENGRWSLQLPRGEFMVTACHENYLDSVIQNLEVNLSDDIEINFVLHQSQCEINPAEVNADLPAGDSLLVPLQINNPGNGILSWSSNLRAPENLPPWSLRYFFEPLQQIENLDIKGLTMLDGNYFVAGTIDGEGWIFALNGEHEIISQFSQQNNTADGVVSLTNDGEKIWGMEGQYLLGYTPEGEMTDFLNIHINTGRYVTWDSDEELFWVSGIMTDIYGIDRNGFHQHEFDRNGVTINGLGYFPEDPDGHNLYILHYLNDQGDRSVSRVNTENGELSQVTVLDLSSNLRPVDVSICNSFDVFGCFVFIALCQGREGNNEDIVNVFQLKPNPFWAQSVPNAGEIIPDGIQDVNLILQTVDGIRDITLPLGEYSGEMVFDHDGLGGELSIPILMGVIPSDEVEMPDSELPELLILHPPYPNPFNSQIKIEFDVPHTSQVELSIYDLSGRQLSTLDQGVVTAGNHLISWFEDDFVSGVYFIQLRTGNRSCIRKVVLIE